LGIFAKNMEEVIGVIDFSSPSWQDMMRKKTHNVLTLMLNPGFKSCFRFLKEIYWSWTWGHHSWRVW
jgi:hypothetical protein